MWGVSERVTAREMLREKGMRVTELRRKVLELLAEDGNPMSHMEIFERLALEGRVPDRVTLYRMLNAFTTMQLVHRIRGTDGTMRFSLHKPRRTECPGNHPHFLCRTCGRMICLYGQQLPRIDVPEGNLIEGKQMLVFGICAACRKDKE